jgi:hypothetical protein
VLPASTVGQALDEDVARPQQVERRNTEIERARALL